MEGDFEDSGATQTRRKPDGGFFFFTVTQLMMAWTALREGKINLKELRVYFALAEMKSRRCGPRDDAAPEFSPRELRALVGGAGGEREAVQKLLAVGLLREVSKSSIEFATDPSELRFELETLEATLALIPNPDRRVPVPRRIIRLITGGARRTLIATILGHLIRCMFYKHGACHPKGCVKASWIAEVFGISERRIHEQRQHLIALGWLIPHETSQRIMNGHGLWVTINLTWDRLTEANEKLYEPKPADVAVENTGVGAKDTDGAGEHTPEPTSTLIPTPTEPPLTLSPPPAQSGILFVTPHNKENREPLTREFNNQKPACSGRPGVYVSKPEETGAEKPTLRDVKPEDLRDPSRLFDLHAQAVAAGYISSSEADRLNFFAAANHARSIGSRNPPGLFVRIVRSGLWAFLTQDDDDAGRNFLRRALYPEDEGWPLRGQRSLDEATGLSLAAAAGELSADARFVRDITNLLRRRGIAESSVWRLVNRERPDWTRERWDQAQAELQGTSSPLAVAAAAGY